MAEDIYKSVTIGDEVFIIKKFTAIAGLQIAKFILTKAEPLIPMLEKGLDSDDAADGLLQLAESISDDELSELITKCLKYCYKVFPAGNQAVIDKTGNYGVDGIEYDIKKTVRLCYEAIAWGASDFFGESGLDLKSLPGSNG